MTYANKIDKAEARLDWNQPAADRWRERYAPSIPFPARCVTLAGEPVKVWRAAIADGHGQPGQILAATAEGIVVACGEGALRLTELQKPGGRRVTSADFLHGTPLKPD